MKISIAALFLLCFISFLSCTKSELDASPSEKDNSGQNGKENQAGVITAAEWNDLENWAFWENLVGSGSYGSMPDRWGIYNNNRISVLVMTQDSLPVIDAFIRLMKDKSTIAYARTDNRGYAELWPNMYQYNKDTDYNKFTVEVNQTPYDIRIKPYKDGVNKIITAPSPMANKIEIAFVVDATGSMGDELSYLQTELLDVIKRIKRDNSNAVITTSSVFYRDKGDSYVTRVSNFTDDIYTTMKFIKEQKANGGGDFPEAVHSALDKAVNELQWSGQARARIMFLLLDAPPHNDPSIMTELKAHILVAMQKGIKIIPIAASGIDKETEFLMRFIAMSTNGTYVFITDDSGIGNDHLEPSVGTYQVEYLNDLMVRLVNKYAR